MGGRATTQGYSAVDNVRQKFDGYERDAETNLDYAQARYYASAAGRFTSVDPLAASARLTNPQSFNRYSYALNNPLRYTDPSGMDTDDCDYNNYLLGEEMSDELNQAAQQQQSQQQPQPEPTPVATQSATIANAPTSGAGQLPVTVVVDQMNNPGVRVRDIKGNEALVVGVDLRFTFLDEKGNPVTNATVSEEVVDSTGKKVTQSDKPTPLDAKGQGADLVSNPSGPVPKPDDRKAQMDAIDHFNADFTTEQTLKLTVTTSTGSVVQVTQKRTLTNMTPGASKIAGGLIRGYTFTMEKPKIEKIK